MGQLSCWLWPAGTAAVKDRRVVTANSSSMHVSRVWQGWSLCAVGWCRLTQHRQRWHLHSKLTCWPWPAGTVPVRGRKILTANSSNMHISRVWQGWSCCAVGWCRLTQLPYVRPYTFYHTFCHTFAQPTGSPKDSPSPRKGDSIILMEADGVACLVIASPCAYAQAQRCLRNDTVGRLTSLFAGQLA